MIKHILKSLGLFCIVGLIVPYVITYIFLDFYGTSLTNLVLGVYALGIDILLGAVIAIIYFLKNIQLKESNND